MSEKQNYVVTGASRGIGLELTRQLLAQGHQVVAGARKASLELKALLDENGGRLTILELDVQSDASVARFREGIRTEHIDTLINNAGIYHKEDGLAMRVPPGKILDTLNTNALGPIRMTQSLLPLLQKSKHPRVANVSSLMGSISDNAGGGALAYRVSKTALNMFTKTLSIDEKNMIAISLHPGWVQTDMGGERAPVQPKASAAGLLKVIQGTKLADSGKFFNYDGRELPW